jgi:hypothetical protein
MKVRKGFSSLTALKLTVLVITAVLLLGCVPKVVLTPAVPNLVVQVPSSSNSNPAPAAPTGNADAHYIQPTDYFFMAEPFGSTQWETVYLGKMTIAPTPETKNQAQFLNTSSGITEWAKWWVNTRIANRSELQLGTEVIFFDVTDTDIYRAPYNNQEARSYGWAISRITDTSELFKGYVMVGGGYKISEKNIRVIVK